jgi:hypothetical protein
MFSQEATCGSRASQRSPVAPAAAEGKKRILLCIQQKLN